MSDPAAPVGGEIAWVGLPTGPVPEAYVGGGRDAVSREVRNPSRSSGAPAPSSSPRRSPDSRSGSRSTPPRTGPWRVSPDLAARLGLAFVPDVYGRPVAAGASLEVGGASWPSLWVRRAEAVPAGADAVAGGCLFREAIVEFDPGAGRLRLHDPARFAPPEGFFKTAIDDDDDRPVAVLSRGKKDLRLTAGSDTGEAALLVAAASAERLGLSATAPAPGLAWGPVRLPELPIAVSQGGFFPDWGDDGRLGFPLLLRFHAFVNMPQRWMYLKPAGP